MEIYFMQETLQLNEYCAPLIPMHSKVMCSEKNNFRSMPYTLCQNYGFQLVTGGWVVSTLDCYVGGLAFKSVILPLLKHVLGKMTDCHAGCQEVNRCCNRGEIRECMSLPSVKKAAHSGFETQRRHHHITRSLKHWHEYLHSCFPSAIY